MDLVADSKDEIVESLAQMLLSNGYLASVQDFTLDVQQREAQVSTGIGYGIAIPHARSEAVVRPGIAVGRLRKAIDYDSIDEQPVRLVFLLAVPASLDSKRYLQTLAGLARLLAHETFRRSIMAARSADELLEAIHRAEAKQVPDGS